MTREETAKILDPETTRDELWKYDADTRLDACNEACRMGADALREQQERENPKQLTNADRIRAMNDEDLAKFIDDIADYVARGEYCTGFLNVSNFPYSCFDTKKKCEEHVIDWLKRPEVEG